MELAASYAEANNLELDTELTFEDLGVSAFQSVNARRGALRAFLNATADGTIPDGSFLLLESFDRISRDVMWSGQQVFAELLDAGISIVTLGNERVYSRKTINKDPMQLIEANIYLMRAHEESLTKSRRMSAAYDRKRSEITSGKPLSRPFTRALPGWLLWDDKANQYALIEPRAELVRRIFEKADAGWGQHRIAQWLNEIGEEPWGVGKKKASRWHRSYIKKTLTNRAVLGTPHRQR